MSDQTLLNMNWFHDQSDPENALYILQCPEMPDLQVQIAAATVTERAARAKLIEAAFQKARTQGIDTSRLRFHV